MSINICCIYIMLRLGRRHFTGVFLLDLYVVALDQRGLAKVHGGVPFDLDALALWMRRGEGGKGRNRANDGGAG